MLLYMSFIRNIFELEYTIYKLNSSGRDIFALEKSVYSGQLFWSDESSLDKQELYAADESSHVKKSVAKPHTISTKIINKIVKARRVRRHLFDDLQIIKENLQGIRKFIKNKNEWSIEKAINILINYQYYCFYVTLHGMENVQEIYWKKEQINEFRVMTDCINSFSERYEGIIIYDSGFHVNQALIKPQGCDIETEMYNENTDFNKAYQHPIDEQYLISPNIRVVYNTYGEKVPNNFRITQLAG